MMTISAGELPQLDNGLDRHGAGPSDWPPGGPRARRLYPPGADGSGRLSTTLGILYVCPSQGEGRL